MLRLANICSLTEFRHNSKAFIEQMRNSGSPLVLTVNGRAEIVVYEPDALQDILDEAAEAKEEARRLKEQLLDAQIQIAKLMQRSA